MSYIQRSLCLIKVNGGRETGFYDHKPGLALEELKFLASILLYKHMINGFLESKLGSELEK